MPPTPEVWSVRRLLDWTRDFFERKGVDDPKFSAESLLAHALGCTRLQLFLRHAEVPDEGVRAAFRELVRRRGEHEPPAYLTGTAPFLNFEFAVDRSVLIPRPETEMLVEQVVAHARPYRHKPLAPDAPAPPPAGAPAAEPADAPRAEGFGSGTYAPPQETTAAEPAPVAAASPSATPEPRRPIRVLDLCTGSGCVAVSIAKLLPEARVTATDLSEAALAVARRNAERLGVADRVGFLAGDLFAALPPGTEPFDYLTANPPYVAGRDADTLDRTVRDFEPAVALFGGDDGLSLIRRILGGAAAVLRPGGRLFMELGWDQADAVRSLAEAAPGLAEVSLLPDFQGILRVLKCRAAP
jgi:release factor glutamine methyltransferase